MSSGPSSGIPMQNLPIPESLPLDVTIDEEQIPGYDPKSFYHPNPGDILDGKYVLKAKLGYGFSSTVWLAQVTTRLEGDPDRYRVIKFTCCGHASKDAARNELDISAHIMRTALDHRGCVILSIALASFEVVSPNGSHLCLLLEPMREPLWMFRRRLGADKVTRSFLHLFKTYLYMLLEGLDCLHSICHIIYTDISLDNILVGFEDNSVIESFVDDQLQNPMARKLIDGRAVYRCHNDFGDFGRGSMRKVWPKWSDFRLAERGDRTSPLIHPIQRAPDHAPEVLLGTGWSYSADIWNFGTMVWNLLAGRGLFRTIYTDTQSYSAKHHLAEMIALLGPMPNILVERESNMKQLRWDRELRNDEGRLCSSAADFFGGPFLSDDGKFIRQDLVSSERRLSDELPECITDGEEKELFLRFMGRMLCWLPEDRATAKELKDDPWLHSWKRAE